jgi:hypothetical protein
MVAQIPINPYTSSWTWIVWLVLANVVFGCFAYSLLCSKKQFSLLTKLSLVSLTVALPLIAIKLPIGASTDFYRYIWQGRVSNSGGENYKLKPWDAGTQKFNIDLFERMDWKDKQSVYPPVAEKFFQLNAKMFDAKVFSNLSFNSRLSLARLPNLTLFVLCGLLIYKLTKSKKYMLLWLVNPYFLFELVTMAHIDLLAITFLALTALLLKQNKLTDTRTILAGSLLSLAGLTKLTPFIFAVPLTAYIYLKFGLKHCALFLLGLVLTILPFLNTFVINNFAYFKRIAVWSSGSEIHFANPLYNLLRIVSPNSDGLILKLIFTFGFSLISLNILKAVSSKVYSRKQALKDCTLLSVLPLLASPAILQWYWIFPITLTLYATSSSLKIKIISFGSVSVLLALQYIAGLKVVGENLGQLVTCILTILIISTIACLRFSHKAANT